MTFYRRLRHCVISPTTARVLAIYISELVSGKLRKLVIHLGPSARALLNSSFETSEDLKEYHLGQYEQCIGWLMRGDGSAGTGSQSPFCGLYVMGAMFGSTLFPSLACRLTPDTAAGTRYHITCVSIQFPSQGRV